MFELRLQPGSESSRSLRRLRCSKVRLTRARPPSLCLGAPLEVCAREDLIIRWFVQAEIVGWGTSWAGVGLGWGWGWGWSGALRSPRDPTMKRGCQGSGPGRGAATSGREMRQ